jgi:hypothetical protein
MLIRGPAGRFLTASGEDFGLPHTFPAPSHEAPNRAQIFLLLSLGVTIGILTLVVTLFLTFPILKPPQTIIITIHNSYNLPQSLITIGFTGLFPLSTATYSPGTITIHNSYNLPQSLITIGFTGLFPLSTATYCSLSANSCPSITFPNTTCFPFNHGVSPSVIKNCDPLVLGPALAIEREKGACGISKFSSGNFRP